MNPSPNPLIEAAVAPLSENAEHQLSVTSILAETADPDHPGAAEAIARWKSVDAKKLPFLWNPLLYIAAILSVIVAVSFQVPDLKLAWSYRGMADFDFPESALPEGISAEQKLILGDPSLSNLEQKEALLSSDPENPAYYAEYACEYEKEFGELPEKYFETISRIAPRNSCFLYSAAGALIDLGMIEQKDPASPRPTPRVVDGVTMSPDPVEEFYEIKDEVAFGEFLSLLEKAASLPEYDDYQSTMHGVRLHALPKGGTSMERMNASLVLFKGSNGLLKMIRIGTAISARAQQLSMEGDAESFLRLDGIRRNMTRSILDSPPGSLLNEIILVGSFWGMSKDFHFAAKRLGLEELSDELSREERALRASFDRRRVRMKKADNSWMVEKGSILTAFSLPMVTNIADSPPPMTTEDLTPLRQADHALAMRAGLSACASVLSLAFGIVFLFRFIFPPALRVTASRLVQLLRAGDWAIAVGLGGALPISAILLLQHFTELGGRGWGLEHFHFLFPGVHVLAILLLTLLAPAIFIRWRLARRLAPLGIPCSPGFFSMLATLGIVALAIGAYPVVMAFGMDRPVLKALAAAPAFWLAVVTGHGLHAIIGKPKYRLSLASTSVALLPAYAAAMILTSICLPAFTSVEKQRLAEDTIFNFDADPPSLGQYELRLAAQKRKETREILGLEN